MARSIGVTPADMLLKIVKVPGLALLATIGFLSVSFLALHLDSGLLSISFFYSLCFLDTLASSSLLPFSIYVWYIYIYLYRKSKNK